MIRDICNFNNDIKNIKNKTIQIDDQISYFYYDILNKKNNVTIKIDPCNNLKSIKNNIEIKCSKSAHLNDGIALVKFFYWLEKNIDKKVTEFSASKKLYEYRRQNKDFFSESFPTISATGPNGSIIHYKPKVKSSTLEKDQLYLCDSGGQYFGGTTDITRTIHIGKKKPAKNYKKLYTKVLMGHIDISILKFPLGTTGSQIDTIARANLWSDGLDYNHGTGHGVGSFLGVHEGPQSISKKLNNVILKPGMILSN
ncbi:MAG: M24 family metallopeptidase [Alphaproteobacteria bacterium]